MEEYIYEVKVIQIVINLAFLVEMVILLVIYGVLYALQSRHFMKLEFILQIVNIIALVNFFISSNEIALLKTLQITIIGKSE